MMVTVKARLARVGGGVLPSSPPPPPSPAAGGGGSPSVAGAMVSPHLLVLRCCGFARLPRSAPFVARLAHDAYCAFALAATGTYLLQECVYAFQMRGDMAAVSRVMFLLLCHVTSLVKQLVFMFRHSALQTLLASLDDRALQGRGSSDRRLLRDRARAALVVQRGYSGTAVVTCSLWLALSVAKYLSARRADFPLWLPCACDASLPFAIALSLSHYATTLVGIANTTMDAFVGALLDLYSAQCLILRLELESLCEIRVTDAAGEDVLLPRLYSCLEHYDKICKGVGEVQRLFGGAVLVQFAVGGWILCMAAYKVVDVRVVSVEFASMLLFIVCILTELFLYCYFGHLLYDESARVQDALFGCGWEAWRGSGRGAVMTSSRAVTSPMTSGPVRARRALLLARERARRPLRLFAGGVLPLSLETFVKILKSSYSFYAVLRQTK